jgi:hypothetical protein
MPLDEHEKSELVAAAGLAIDLDEPESFIEALRRVAGKKSDNARLSEQERSRWRLVGQSLQGALAALEDKPGATEAPQTAMPDAVGEKIAAHRP